MDKEPINEEEDAEQSDKEELNTIEEESYICSENENENEEGNPYEKKVSDSLKNRNIIKTVKIHCLRLFLVAIKECITFKNPQIHNWKIRDSKRPIYKIFKSDISKKRNKIIMDLQMHQLMKFFSNVNFQVSTFTVKENMRDTFNFFNNITWRRYLLLYKHQNRDLYELIKDAEDVDKLIPPHYINWYFKYIETDGKQNNHPSLDKKYLKIFEQIEKKLNNKDN